MPVTKGPLYSDQQWLSLTSNEFHSSASIFFLHWRLFRQFNLCNVIIKVLKTQ